MLDAVQNVVNWLFAPEYLFTLTIVALIAFIRWRKFCTQNRWMSLAILSSPLVFFGVSALEENFWIQLRRPDNVPIAILMFSVLFFIWLAMRKAVINDERTAEGRPVLEADPDQEEKVFVWPDLVYIEFIAALIVAILLVVWSIVLPAPLEEPANPQLTPNPSKAPWYFLGLQEILVYFDPWLAGVLVPTLIIIGLMAIPYIDTNPKGNGYYTFAERRSEIFLYLFGFIVLWVFLVFEGTFLRGPNWNFYGPYEYWDVHKVVPLTNVQLSEYIYTRLLGIGLPENWLVREIWGILLLGLYFVALPIWLAKKWFRGFFEQLGPIRYGVSALLILVMMLVPIKMYLRWTINLKYFVAIPEFFFNI